MRLPVLDILPALPDRQLQLAYHAREELVSWNALSFVQAGRGSEERVAEDSDFDATNITQRIPYGTASTKNRPQQSVRHIGEQGCSRVLITDSKSFQSAQVYPGDRSNGEGHWGSCERGW